uniref:Uncharacterized protein n=1 Tax=Oryza sativa subsp. japonica TaxID=39947 RepID=Q69K94_ORYSJ|nr:hypothetical protein [Oryza sativa Japonica Group]
MAELQRQGLWSLGLVHFTESNHDPRRSKGEGGVLSRGSPAKNGKEEIKLPDLDPEGEEREEEDEQERWEETEEKDKGNLV